MEDKIFWYEFFQLYKSLPPLWRLKDPDYSNREVKSECYEQLANKLKELYPDADRELVVRKINNFRTSFRKEIRKLREYKQAGRHYKPTLWYFDNLSFLIDQDELSSISYKQEVEAVEEKVLPTQLKRKLNTQDESNVTKSNREKIRSNQYLNFEEEYLPGRPKRKTGNHQTFVAKEPLQSNQNTVADILAKSWAVQYKEMSGNQKLIARKLISDILFHGCLGTLQMSHAIKIQNILLSETNENHQYVFESESAMESSSTVQFIQHEDADDNCSLHSES